MKNVVKTKTKEQLVADYKELFERKVCSTNVGKQFSQLIDDQFCIIGLSDTVLKISAHVRWDHRLKMSMAGTRE